MPVQIWTFGKETRYQWSSFLPFLLVLCVNWESRHMVKVPACGLHVAAREVIRSGIDGASSAADSVAGRGQGWLEPKNAGAQVQLPLEAGCTRVVLVLVIIGVSPSSSCTA